MVAEKRVWIEYIGNQCYALAGMHLISRLTSNWIWATFEPQNMLTNPKRCVALGCKDAFGSEPANTPSNQPGATTQISQRLRDLMVAAKLNPVWQNYRLDGVQTDFVDQSGKAILSGKFDYRGGERRRPAQSIVVHYVSRGVFDFGKRQ